MPVPVFVPADVPGAGGQPAARNRARTPRKSNDGNLPHLTVEPSGWRFQMRVPAALTNDFALAGVSPIIRASLGPRGRGEARRLARKCAASCDAIFALAVAHKEATVLGEPSNDPPNQLVQQVVDACQNVIKNAVAQPKTAIQLAHALAGSLSTLRLVQTEVARGEAGAVAVVQRAEELTRGALRDVLKHASDPLRADDLLRMTSVIAPSHTSPAALATLPAVAELPPTPPAALASASLRVRRDSQLPKYSEVSQAYIDMRIEKDGADHPDISILQMRRQTFIDVVGDFPVDTYYPSDLQTYVNRMQYWPANVTKRSDMEGKSTNEILDANRNYALKPMALKTMQDGYVANIRTMTRYSMADLHYRDPFTGVRLRWPKILRASRPREPISVNVTNRVFKNGIASGQLDETVLPPFAKLTGRRLGLLIFLQGTDIRQKDGVWIAQTSGIYFSENKWQRVPIKTPESMTFFVINNFFVEIGLVDWMSRQTGWIFAAPHEHPDPSKYESKVMARLLRRSGAEAGQVFHSLRGEAIDEMRKAKLDSRSNRLQAGHELADVHELYGFRALSADECQQFANLPLPPGIDWNVFRGLDFDKLAAARRTAGRWTKKGG